MKINQRQIALAAFSFFLLGFTIAAAQVPAPGKAAASQTAAKPHKIEPVQPAPSLLPTQEQVEASLKRTFGYDPGLSWQILDIRPSGILGIAEIVVSINKNAPNHIFLPAEGQRAIVGDIIPFGPNPYAPARTKLEAADGPARGPKNPTIYFVEFSDLQCPHCAADCGKADYRFPAGSFRIPGVSAARVFASLGHESGAIRRLRCASKPGSLLEIHQQCF
jgi:protein-disulfide isomerase